MTSINHYLTSASRQLQTISHSAELDAALIFCHVLKCERAYLYAHSQTIIGDNDLQLINHLLAQRLQGVPMAYLLGEQEFWSLPIEVNQSVLIPRADTEVLVQAVLDNNANDKHLRIVDAGTGSGAIALALAWQCTNWQVMAIDKQLPSLMLAQKNAQQLALSNISFIASDWLAAVGECDVIVSNPPYIAADDPHLQQLCHEPQHALIADDNGFSDLKKLIRQARECLTINGYLFLEHGYSQGKQVLALLEQYGYHELNFVNDLAGHHRVSYGVWRGGEDIK